MAIKYLAPVPALANEQSHCGLRGGDGPLPVTRLTPGEAVEFGGAGANGAGAMNTECR